MAYYTKKNSGQKVKMVRKPNWLKIVCIVIICLVLGFYGKIVNFFGRFTGEAGSDGRKFAAQLSEEVSDFTGESRQITLAENEGVAYLPAKTEFAFTSEDSVQTLALGNPAENEAENIYLAFELTVSGETLLETGILKPGEGIAEADLSAYFKPNDTYNNAYITYILYEKGNTRVKKLEEVKQDIALTVTGSSEYYDNKEGKEE